ncbi:hypothetical protein [Bradyrhizobium hereditatis]|uniref:hypothetical protein n=1 Tax=Bradyrhizobium hereditatis TaxID=2821405 RepID=UPI001CE33080|nr:hypothetical protein [Bradyrhizobium hereditatis]
MHVHVAENETVRVGDVTFAGATLWTDVGLNGHAHRAMMTAGDRMNDFKKIRISNYEPRFLPHNVLMRHLNSVAFLDAEMRKPRGGDRLVLVMHHAPVRQMPPQRSVRRATSPSTPPTAAI